jgi:hypothetical protein
MFCNIALKSKLLVKLDLKLVKGKLVAFFKGYSNRGNNKVIIDNI